MADTVRIDWIYPPKLEDGSWDDNQGNQRVVVRLSGTSDGTGETHVRKIDLSDLKTHNGGVPSKTVAEWVQYHILGMAVSLEWDRTPHGEICRINANGQEADGNLDWRKYGGLLDPGAAGDGTGDILLSSTNVDSGDSYDITLCLRLKD